MVEEVAEALNGIAEQVEVADASEGRFEALDSPQYRREWRAHWIGEAAVAGELLKVGEDLWLFAIEVGWGW